MGSEKQLPDFTDEERRLLRHEAFVAAVMRSRLSNEPATDEKSRWQWFLGSPGGVALITVVLGGLLGQWVTHSVQTRTAERVANLEEIQAENDRKAATHKEYLARRLAVVTRGFELIGSTVSAAEDLIALTRPEWTPHPTSASAGESALREERDEIRERFNVSDKKWRSERTEVGFLIAYYHGNSSIIYETWCKLEELVSSYVDCSQRSFVAHGAGSGSRESACEDSQLKDVMDDLIGELASPSAADALPDDSQIGAS